MTTLREFSSYGPCIRLGEIVSDTKSHYAVHDRHGEVTKIMKHGKRVKNGLVHASPCRSCQDHAESQYPNGYEN